MRHTHLPNKSGSGQVDDVTFILNSKRSTQGVPVTQLSQTGIYAPIYTETQKIAPFLRETEGPGIYTEK
jgi:hypothetical protein